MMNENRCGWELSSEKMKFYHDHRWRRPLNGGRHQRALMEGGKNV